MSGRAVVVRDAVWGDVELAPELVDLLGAPELQRMRGIRQLGTAHLVYPSANHTRFEHGLGTCHVAGRILDALERNARGPDERPAPGLARLIRAAALVHDVGHVPFGHTFEDERALFPRHDRPERTRHFLREDGALGAALARHGLREGVLAALSADEHDLPGLQLARDVVAGTVCADLLDYLARDALFTGIRRVYDERLLRYFAVREGRLALCLHKRGLLREDAHSEVVHLLRMRYTLTERVYFHHAKVASGALVSRMVERAAARGLVLEDLFGLGDEGLLLHLEARYAGEDAVLARLLDDLRARRLPKRAYLLTRRLPPGLQEELVARYHRDRAGRERLEAELEQELGLEPGDVIVWCPGPEMSLKEADIPVDVGQGRLRLLRDLALSEVDDLLEKHRNLWRFYVLLSARRAERAGELARACAERLGVPDARGAGDW